jgi:hypothetical protein
MLSAKGNKSVVLYRLMPADRQPWNCNRFRKSLDERVGIFVNKFDNRWW